MLPLILSSLALITAGISLALHFRPARVFVTQVKLPDNRVMTVEAPVQVKVVDIELPTIPVPDFATCSNCKRVVARFKVTPAGTWCPNCEVKYAS